jgi:hypothetical protein
VAVLGGGRVGGQYRAGQAGAQLPEGLAAGAGQDPGFHRRGGRVGQRGHGLDDRPGLGVVDLPGPQRRRGAGEPAGQVDRDVQPGSGGDAGQPQRGGDLLDGEVADRRPVAAQGRFGAAAGGQVGDQGQLPGLHPGGQPVGRHDGVDQGVIGQIRCLEHMFDHINPAPTPPRQFHCPQRTQRIQRRHPTTDTQPAGRSAAAPAQPSPGG